MIGVRAELYIGTASYSVDIDRKKIGGEITDHSATVILPEDGT